MANTKITSRVLADNAVLTANITDANVTTAKIAADAITGAKIADDVALGGNPTTSTQSAGNNTTRVATTAFVSTAVSNLVDSSPSALNTLNELAAALGDDANFSTTVTNSIAAKLPLAGGTMTGDLILGDNVKVEIGSASGGDLQLYHDGSNSYIHDAGTGQLRVSTSEFKVLNAAQGEAMIAAIQNGAVTLYHDNAAKLATTSTGIDVTGTLKASGTVLSTAAAQVNSTSAGGFGFASNNTAFYSFGADTSTAGSYTFQNLSSNASVNITAMKIEADGKVGIGVSPARTFTVKSAAANSTQISLVDNDSTNEVFAVGQQSDGDGFLTVKQDDGTTKVQFDASGDSFIAGGSLHVGSTDSVSSSAEVFSVYNAGTGHSKMVNSSDSYGTLYMHNESTTADTFQPFIVMQKGGGNRGNIGLRHSDSVLGISGQNGISLRTNSTSVQAATEALKIDSSGRITAPYQPAFLVTPATTQSNIAASTNVTIAFGTEIFDVGSNFASNTFTAPVTGKYQLNVNLRLNNVDSAANYYHINLVTSNRVHYSIFDPDFGQDAAYYTIQLSVLADMDANDTASVSIFQSAAAAQTDIHSGIWSTFSGYLVA